MQYHPGLLRQRGHGQFVYHKGLLRQKGHGFLGSLFKVAAPLVSNLVGGLLGGAQQQPPPPPPGYYPPQNYQRGEGFFTDLLKTGAKHALTAAARTGLDVLENKRSLKDAVKTHGVQALKNTSGMVKQRMNLGGTNNRRKKTPMLARGGPKRKRKTQGGGIPKRKRPLDVFD